MSVYRITLMETSANSNNDNKYFPDTDSRCVLNTFTENESRTAIRSGEQLNESMGKISKYLKDLQTHAFTQIDAGSETSPASSKKLNDLTQTVNTAQTAIDNCKLKHGASLTVENERLYLLNENGTKLNKDGVKVVSDVILKNVPSTTVGAMWYE